MKSFDLKNKRNKKKQNLICLSSLQFCQWNVLEVLEVQGVPVDLGDPEK